MVRLSYTTISSYLSCPAKVYYSLQEGLKFPKGAALIYGSVFHETLAKRLTGQKFTVADAIVPYLMGKKDSERDWDGTIQFNSNDWPVDTMLSWLETTTEKFIVWLKSQRTSQQPQAVELRLSNAYKTGDTTYQFSGVIDALWDGALIDFKLSGARYKPDKMQAACYAILNGGPSSFNFAIAYKEKVPRFEVKPVVEAKDGRYLLWVEKRIIVPVARAIERGDFPANPSYQFCSDKWCQYWSICMSQKEIK